MGVSQSLRKSDAVNRVFERFGFVVCTLLKSGLNRYGIELDGRDNSCNLEEIFYALKAIVGIAAAEVIMQEIYIELDAMSSE
jgi:hypothetical protein